MSGEPGYHGFEEDLANLYGVYNRSASLHKSSDLAELSLIIVGKDCRGSGLGKELLLEAKRIAESNGKKGLFFYTDTDCNYGIYDYLGAERVSDDTIMCAGEELTVYCYRWSNS